MVYYNQRAFNCGPVVKRLRHRPFTAVSWVRIPSGSPTFEERINFVDSFFYFFLFSKARMFDNPLLL